MSEAVLIYFLSHHLILSILLIAVLTLKKTVKKHTTVKAQYIISKLTLAVLFLPLFSNLIHLPGEWSWSNGALRQTFLASQERDKIKSAGYMTASTNWMQDFTTTATHTYQTILLKAIIVVWLFGVLLFLFLTVLNNSRILSMRKKIKLTQDSHILSILQCCKTKARYHHNIGLGEADFIKSPITFGIFKPYIVLPSQYSLSEEQLQWVLLHELFHRKNFDIAVNYLMCLCRILFWFNPLVWCLLQEMRLEREIVCDHCVLMTMDEKQFAEYGMTILGFTAPAKTLDILFMVSGMSSSKKQVVKRIRKIATYQTESFSLKLKSAVVFSIAVMLTIASVPLVTATANSKEIDLLKKSHVVYKDYSSFFEGFTGSFVLYDSKNDQYTIYNQNESTKRVSPNSTYKIYDLLFSLESQIITKDDSVIPWDKTVYPYPTWNRDQDMYSAMQSSVSWYFQSLDKKLGAKALQSYVNKIGYGNRDLSGGVSQYWYNSSLQISPLEQVNLLRAFYYNDINFSVQNIDAVKDSIFLEESNGAKLYGKTGTFELNGSLIDGWFIGYVEHTDNTFIFAVHIKSEDNASGSNAAKIALDILDSY